MRGTGTQNSAFARAVALLTCISFFLTYSNSSQAASGAQNAAQATNAANMANAANGANNLGNINIADGTKNQQQGESTQNMAQMAMGAMQIAMGLLGLLAALAASQKSDKSDNRASNLSGLNNYATGGNLPTSPTPKTTTSDLGAGSVSQLDPSDLRKEPLNTALSSIEKNYGIPRDNFVAALKNGVDPKDIFANAPKNAVSPDLLNQIAAGLASDSSKIESDKNSLAGSSAEASGPIAAGGAGTGAPSGASENAGGARSPASTDASMTFDDLNAPGNNLSLSPEIRAAMAAKAEQVRREKEMKEMHGWTIFQLVANRYRKLEPMLYGRVEKTNLNPVPPEIRN